MSVWVCVCLLVVSGCVGVGGGGDTTQPSVCSVHTVYAVCLNVCITQVKGFTDYSPTSCDPMPLFISHVYLYTSYYLHIPCVPIH